MYICDFSRSVGAGSATTRNTRGLTRSVLALITPPFPAVSRPSNTMQTFAPDTLTHSCMATSSACSGFSSRRYSLFFMGGIFMGDLSCSAVSGPISSPISARRRSDFLLLDFLPTGFSHARGRTVPVFAETLEKESVWQFACTRIRMRTRRPELHDPAKPRVRTPPAGQTSCASRVAVAWSPPDLVTAFLRGCPGSRGRRLRVRLGGRDGVRRTDEAEMAERLREVAALPPASDVVLLGQQAQVVAQADEPVEQGARILGAAVEGQCADQPERAGEKLSF